MGSLLIFAIFLFAALACWALVGILWPALVVNWTVRYFAWALRFLGMEAAITPTGRAYAICRIWNAFKVVFFLSGIVFMSTQL